MGGRSRTQTVLGSVVAVTVMLGVVRVMSRAAESQGLRGTAGGSTTESKRPVLGGRSGTEYLTIIDAGSSGCRAHVFKYRAEGSSATVDPAHENLKVRPGLSSFASNPAGAGDAVRPLLDFLREQIPEPKRASAPIFLKATAGLRMVSPDERDAILAAVREVFANSEFAFDPNEGAKVIAGTDEGGFGWMSVNSLLGALSAQEKNDDKTTTVVEMGGASAQVTALHSRVGGGSAAENKDKADSLPEGYAFDFQQGPTKYELYAKSYLGYGLEKAREALTEYLDKSGATSDPCLNAGFEAAKAGDQASGTVYDGALPGAGDADKCKDAVEAALFAEPSGCDFASCSGIQRSYQPADLAANQVLVFENFYYTAQMLGAPHLETPAAFLDAAKTLACKPAWSDLLASDLPADGSDKKDLTKLCFSAVYLSTFLQAGLKLPPNKRLRVQQAVGDFGIDWSLGAAIREANRLAHG